MLLLFLNKIILHRYINQFIGHMHFYLLQTWLSVRAVCYEQTGLLWELEYFNYV